jgi:hypothetical protein
MQPLIGPLDLEALNSSSAEGIRSDDFFSKPAQVVSDVFQAITHLCDDGERLSFVGCRHGRLLGRPLVFITHRD